MSTPNLPKLTAKALDYGELKSMSVNPIIKQNKDLLIRSLDASKQQIKIWAFSNYAFNDQKWFIFTFTHYLQTLTKYGSSVYQHSLYKIMQNFYFVYIQTSGTL